MPPAVAEIVLLVGSILRFSVGATNAESIIVDASRTVPGRGELTFSFGNLDDSMQELGQQLNSVQNYRGLADSLASELTLPKRKHMASLDKQKAFASSVNRALSDHLFLEQGYRLDYDFRVLMSKANSRAAVSGRELDPGQFGYLVEMHLRDGVGRKHLFEDVGSGIGYVLPVLCALSDPREHSICFVQQPELHIHPALQAAMGDVLIENSGGGIPTVVETHSEHLLLRILKRVRQTHLQTDIAPELQIKPTDVCVLYFEPLPDGATKVRPLRLTEDGDFMDHWPRGFFSERDQELFDE